MECMSCGSKDLHGLIRVAYNAPLAVRAGGIMAARLHVAKIEVREAWEQLRLRPVFCVDCGAEHTYDVAAKKLVVGAAETEEVEELRERTGAAERRAEVWRQRMVKAEALAKRWQRKAEKLGAQGLEDDEDGEVAPETDEADEAES